MTLNEFQIGALKTAQYPEEFQIIYPALGLSGEVGEVNDKIKKILRDNDCSFTKDKREEIAKELGDVFWYVATLAHDLCYTLEEIGQMNYEKLKSRKERGVISGSGDNR